MPDGPALPNVKGFDRVVICGPVWTSYPAVPLRTFLRRTRDMPATIGLLLTQASNDPAQKAHDAACADLARSFTAFQVISNADENTENETRRVHEFITELNTTALQIPPANGARLQ